MNPARRRFLFAGAAAAGLTAAVELARRFDLVAPDSSGLYAPGTALTYAAQRLLTTGARAREFSREQISAKPFANPVGPLGADFARLQAGSFRDWKLTVDGMVAHPLSLTLADLRALPAGRQVTEVVCEEGWSYIAEWIGTPLHEILRTAGTLPQARYVVYYSHEEGWWDSIDRADALHPQTILTWAMNGADLPVPFGGPLRMRVPRQLGYKSTKYVNRLTATDNLKGFGKGLGSASPEFGYSWYAGI